MGLFSLIGGNKKKEEEEKKKQLERQEEAKQKLLEDQKKAHEDLPWPRPMPVSRIKVQGNEETILEDPVTEERKNEIGQLVYEEKLSYDSIKDLKLEELLFVLTAQEFFNAKSPLQNFSENHRVMYNELLSRIRDAQDIYCVYDKATNYPFVNNNFAYIYLDETAANAAVEVYNKQFRNLFVKKCPSHPEGTSTKDQGFFDYLYYLGIEKIIIDNGRYRARFSRSEIVAPPNFSGDSKNKPPMNPGLRLFMLDFLSEARWPVKYEKRIQVLQTKELRMVAAIRKGHYIVPVQHEGPAEVMDDGRIKFSKDTKLRFPVMKTKDEKVFLPIFTDGIEFSKRFGKAGFEGAVFGFADVLRFVADKDGIVINPMGENIMLQRDKLYALEAAAISKAAKANEQAKTETKKLSREAIIKGASAEDVAQKIIQMPAKNKEELNKEETNEEADTKEKLSTDFEDEELPKE